MAVLIGAWLLASVPSAPAAAHFSWLGVVSADGDLVQVEVLFGHHLTPERRVDDARLVRVVALGRDGRPDTLAPGQAGWRHAVAAPGSHVIGAEMHPRFWSRTTTGGRNGSRREYPDALSCRASDDAMKTVVLAGVEASSDDTAVAVVLGHTLEIVPLADPARLAVGDALPLRVMFRGQPWQGALRATWEGYPAAHDDDYPVALVTDAKGHAELPLSRAGTWLVHATTQADHADPAVCDRQAWNATLTFGLR
jgi:uncharacterized GH25 family protein